MKHLYLLIVMMTTVVLMAADPVGKITSSGPLTLNGKAVPATAGSSLPIVAGDEIVTSSSPATVCFGDRSRAKIEPNSRVKLETRDTSVALHVLSGSVDLNRAKGSQVSLIQPIRGAAPNLAVVQVPAQPTVTPDCDDDKPPSRSKPCPPNNPHCK